MGSLNNVLRALVSKTLFASLIGLSVEYFESIIIRDGCFQYQGVAIATPKRKTIIE